jgi:hypothetical protein
VDRAETRGTVEGRGRSAGAEDPLKAEVDGGFRGFHHVRGEVDGAVERAPKVSRRLGEPGQHVLGQGAVRSGCTEDDAGQAKLAHRLDVSKHRVDVSRWKHEVAAASSD